MLSFALGPLILTIFTIGWVVARISSMLDRDDLKYNDSIMSNNALVVFIGFIILIQTAISMYFTKEICGYISPGWALSVSVPTMLFLVGGVALAIRLLPTWLLPFRNTIGRLATWIVGIENKPKDGGKPKTSDLESWTPMNPKVDLISTGISEMIWYILSSSLGAAVVANLLSSGRCTPSIDKLEQVNRQWMENLNKKASKEKVNYTIH